MIDALLDTHVWIWCLGGSPHLGKETRGLLASRKNRFGLSPLTIWEARMLGERGRVQRLPQPAAWIEDALKEFEVKDIPLTRAIARVVGDLRFSRADPIDAFLAAAAHSLGVPLVTADERLLGLAWLKKLDARR